MVDLADDAVAAPQPHTGVGQQHQEDGRIGEQVAAVAFAYRQLGVEGTVELAAQAVERGAHGGGGDLGFQAVFQRALLEDHARSLDDGVHLLDHRRRAGDLLGRDVAQDLVDARRQRRTGCDVVAQDLAQKVVQGSIQPDHQARRRQRAFDAAQLGLEVGHGRRQEAQGLAQRRVVARELGGDQLLALHGVVQLGVGGVHGRAGGFRQRVAEALLQFAHARQLGGQLRGGRCAADMGAQDIGIPLGVELFQLAQVEHDVVADLGIGPFRADIEKGEQRGQHQPRQAGELQAATRFQARYALRQHGNHLVLRYIMLSSLSGEHSKTLRNSRAP